MVSRIVLGVLPNCCLTPTVRYYSQRAIDVTAKSIKKAKKPPQNTSSLQNKKITVVKESIPTPLEIIEDPKLFEDMIRFYKDPQKYSGK